MIEVKNVTKKYGNFVAVDNISFTVNDGEVVGFLGPNGAGKSTTMNMITGFIEPTDGTIIVNGFDASKQSIISLSFYHFILSLETYSCNYFCTIHIEFTFFSCLVTR